MTRERAMLIRLIYPTTSIKPPRLQYIDSAILNYFAGLQDFYFKMEDLHSFYQGVPAQLIMGESIGAEAISPGKISFWVREKTPSIAEVDSVIPFRTILVP